MWTEADARLPVVVVGGGMAGLAAAWRLHRAGVPVTLLEKCERVGGVVGTVEVGGHRFERGPTTVLASSEHITTLVDELGLGDAVVTSDERGHRRFVWRHGELHELPGGPGALFGTRLLSWRGKLRLFAEPFIRAPAAADRQDETVSSFLGRRLGKEAVSALIDPFVTGVFAGTPATLGADAFPRLVAFERESGSLVRGMIAMRKATRAAAAAGRGAPAARSSPGRTPLLTFPEGLATLPRTIRRALGTRVRLGHDVFALEPRSDGRGWQVHAVADERQVHYDASAVILAVPAYAAATLVERVDREVSVLLAAVPHPHVATIGLGYPRGAVTHPLDGFGLLCAGDSPLPEGCEPILGALFVSSIFAGRAPDGHVSISVMIGGSRDPEAADRSDGELVSRARRAIGLLLGARGEPTAVSVARWRQAIPQYPPGHARHMTEVSERLRRHAGLHLAGNYLAGVGLEPTIGSGIAAASAVIEASPPA